MSSIIYEGGVEMDDYVQEALERARDVMGSTIDALNSGQPSRHRTARAMLEHEIEIVREAIRRNATRESV
jgi:hypothetical protein